MVEIQRRDFLKVSTLGAAMLAMPEWLKAAGAASGQVTAAKKALPNIVYVLCDDLGLGDVHCLNPERGKIPTPNMDRLAGQGMVFSDAHSASAVCTPTRYGILTGRYPWRSKLKSGVLSGTSPALIAADRLTVPMLLKERGYHTAAIGKWHLGLDWTRKQDAPASARPGWDVDYTQPIKNGPTALGFDYFYGIAASLDMPPYVFIENDRAVGVPTVEKKFPVGNSRLGPATADFEAVNVMPALTRKAVEYIGRRAAEARAGKPFFLYLPFSAPHTPVAPVAEVKGRTTIGLYGDFVVEVDQCLGEVMAALDQAGLSGDTLLIFTSDNGFAPYVGYFKEGDAGTGGNGRVHELEQRGHYPSASWRGYKSDAWEGGHHIPFFARWPGKIKAGSTCGETICLNDLMATCAALTGAKLPDNAGEDSVSILPALLGEKRNEPLREATVHASINGQLAIRQGPWKLILCPWSGGWAGGEKYAPQPGAPPFQLYDLSRHPDEQVNECATRPEVVARMKKSLERIIREGRSTPGAPQKNDGPQWWPQISWMEGYQAPRPAAKNGSRKKSATDSGNREA